MKDVLQVAIKEAKRLGAEYADVRYMDRKSEPLATKNGAVQSMASIEDKGFGVRVLAKGGWGFSSSNTLNEAELKRCAAEAVAIAKASAKVQAEPITLSPLKPVQDVYRTKVKIDPFDIPMDERLDFLRAIDQELKSLPEIRVA